MASSVIGLARGGGRCLERLESAAGLGDVDLAALECAQDREAGRIGVVGKGLGMVDDDRRAVRRRVVGRPSARRARAGA